MFMLGEGTEVSSFVDISGTLESFRKVLMGTLIRPIEYILFFSIVRSFST